MRWPSYRKNLGVGPPDWFDVPVFDVGEGCGWVLLIVVGALLILALLPAIVLVFEAVIAVIASFILRRSWIVRATCADPPEVREWRVRGVFRSRAAVREVADELRRGVVAEPEHALP